MRRNEEITCPFVNCDHKIKNVANFNIHKTRKHRYHTDKDIKSATVFDDTVDSAHSDVGCEVFGVDVLEGSSSTADSQAPESFIESVSTDVLEHRLASLFLSMQTVLHVSKNATQKIILELSDVEKLASELSVEKITDVLLKHGIDRDSTVFQEIAKVLLDCYPLIKSTAERGSFSTQYRCDLYFKEHFAILKPTEYTFERTHKSSFVYVSIHDTLDSLLSNPDILDKIVFDQGSASGQIRSYQCTFE